MSGRPQALAFLLAMLTGMVSVSNAGPVPIPLPEAPASGPGSNAADRAPVSFGDHWRDLGLPGRWGQAGIYDESRGRLIIFGGRVGIQLRGDLWTLSTGRGSTWQQVEALGTPPSPRSGAAAVHDRSRDRMLLFFGQDSTGPLGDVWELSLNGRPSWRRLEPAGTPPSARFGQTATLDVENDRVIVFGGGSDPPHGTLDAQAWQLALSPRLEWSRMSVEGAGPCGRAYHSAVYAPDLHGMLIFGGLWMTGSKYGFMDEHDSTDVWLLSTRGTARWTDLTPRITGTPIRGIHGHGAVYDAANGRMFVLPGDSRFGSGVYPSNVSHVWSLSLDDLAWTATRGAGPTPRSSATVVADGTGGMLVFGGSPDSPLYAPFLLSSYSETWRLGFAGTPAWSRVAPATAPPAPSRQSGQSAVYDPVRDRALLWQNGILWSRSASGEGEWEVQPTEGSSPPQAIGHVVVYDSRRDRLIVYGGAGDDWHCEKRAWTLSLSSPMTWSLLEHAGDAPDRRDCSAIYDPVRDRMIIYGGTSSVYDWAADDSYEGDVWALRLTGTPSWERIAGTRDTAYWAPFAREASAVYDSRRDRMIVFGGGGRGFDGWGARNDVWALSLDGTPQWHQLAPGDWHSTTGAPEPRAFHAALYDEIGDRMLVLGGCLPGPFGDGPWDGAWAFELSTAQWARLAPSGGPCPIWSYPLAIRDTRRHSTTVMEDGLTWSLEQGPGRSGGRAAGPVSSQPVGELAVLGLRVLRSNPGSGPVTVEFSLPDAAPARLELFDIAGRRLWSRDVGSFGPGDHAMAIGDGLRAPTGLYWLRLARGRDVRTLKVVRVE